METPSNVKREASGDSLLSPSASQTTHEVPSLTSSLDSRVSGPTAETSISPNNEEFDKVDEPATTSSSNDAKEEPLDSESIKGIFGWETLDNTSIPYLLRRGRKYVSIRIVERKLLSKYPNASPDELGKKDPLVSHFISDAEANLLNEINVSHCDYEYGETPFTEKDLVVDLEEFQEFFKIVKRTFPEEILASMKGDVPPSPQPVETPPSPELSQSCGWIQINNTVSPYIIRGSGKEQVKLVPLSVIIYAAGLLANANVKGVHPTPVECKMLNAACKAAGFDFTFGLNTRLITISEVVQRCQVQIFELPLTNPLQHAHYLDHRMVPPMSSVLTSALRQPPLPSYSSRGAHMNPPMPLDSMGGRPQGFMSPFHPRTPGHDLSSSLRPGGMVPPGMNFDPRQMGPDKKLSNLDPSQFPASIQQALLEKCHRIDNTAALNTMSKMSPNARPPYWSMVPGQPPPAHSGKSSMASKTPPSPFSGPPVSPASSSVSYHPLSLPPNPHLHPNPLDISQPMHRMPSPSPTSKDSHVHNSAHPKQGHQGPMPSPKHQRSPYHSTFGNNHFNSSLFTPGNSMESKKSVSQPSSSLTANTHHQSTFQMTSKHQIPNLPQRNIVSSLNHQPQDLVKCISACLVNGKSISCLDANSSKRKGKYCLVEAVSKLYFPTVPIAEFLKVLQVVLKANLHPCTREEETAFVQYYNLPAPRLKCNQMILVEDLKRYFPQLTYVFSRRNVSTEETNGDRGLKRMMDSDSSGTSKKQALLGEMVSRMGADKQSLHGDGAGTSNGSGKASVIVIDD